LVSWNLQFEQDLSNIAKLLSVGGQRFEVGGKDFMCCCAAVLQCCGSSGIEQRAESIEFIEFIELMRARD
jgi:hypothetical protein